MFNVLKAIVIDYHTSVKAGEHLRRFVDDGTKIISLTSFFQFMKMKGLKKNR